jgi:hypothetical protein
MAPILAGVRLCELERGDDVELLIKLVRENEVPYEQAAE